MLNRIRQFMYGRYGNDQLNMALSIFGCVLTFLFSFFRFNPVVYYVLRVIGLIPFVFMFIRMFSKNIEKRRAENEKFITVFTPWKDFIKKKAEQLKDNEHKYYKCSKCGHTLRVPKNRGKIEITCPYCGKKFKKRT